MLKKPFRLKRHSAFQATYKLKNSYYSNGIVLWVGKKKTEENTFTKVGFVVSKKTHKRAVKRNRLKRLMRESYRLLQKNNYEGEYKNRISLIFAAYEKALENNFETTFNTIKDLLDRIHD